MALLDISKLKKKTEKKEAPDELPSLPDDNKKNEEAPSELPPLKDLPNDSNAQNKPAAEQQATGQDALQTAQQQPSQGQEIVQSKPVEEQQAPRQTVSQPRQQPSKPADNNQETKQAGPPQTPEQKPETTSKPADQGPVQKSDIAKKTHEQIQSNIEKARQKYSGKPEEHDISGHRNFENSLFVEVQRQLSDPEKRTDFEKNFLNVNPITEIKERIKKSSKDTMITEYEKVINEYVEKLKIMETNWRSLQEQVDDKKAMMRKLEHDIDEKTFELKNLIMKLHEVRFEER